MSNKDYRRSVHAELHVLIRAHLTDGDMYVATITKTGYLTLSKPCLSCTALMAEAGVSQVFWTVRDRLAPIKAQAVMDDPPLAREYFRGARLDPRQGWMDVTDGHKIV